MSGIECKISLNENEERTVAGKTYFLVFNFTAKELGEADLVNDLKKQLEDLGFKEFNGRSCQPLQVQIEGFNSLEQEQQTKVLKALAQCFTKPSIRDAVAVNFKGCEQKALHALVRTNWDALATSCSGNTPAQKRAQHWLIPQTLDKYNDNFRYPRHCFSSSPDAQQESSFYALLLGSDFFQEILDYIAQLDPATAVETLGGRGKEFKYDREPNGSFQKDLKALSACAYFPLNLELPYKHSYSKDEFNELLTLIRVAKKKGIQEINLHSDFREDQLKAILELIQKANENGEEICVLKGVGFLNYRDGKPISDQIKEASLKNFQQAHHKRILGLLELRERLPELKIEEKKGIIEHKREAKGQERAPTLDAGSGAMALAKKGSGLPLQEFLAQIQGGSAQVHLQVQQQQQQEQLQHQEQKQERHQEAQQAAQSLDAKEIVDYKVWVSDYRSEYLKVAGPLNFFDQEFLTKNNPSQDDLWWGLTLNGLNVDGNIEGFTRTAFERLLKHISLFREGFNFKTLPQGFVVRPVAPLKAGQAPRRILFYDPNFSEPSHPLTPRLTSPVTWEASNIHYLGVHCLFKQHYDESKTEKALSNLFFHKACYERQTDCSCYGCSQTPAKAAKTAEALRAEIFDKKHSSRADLNRYNDFFQLKAKTRENRSESATIQAEQRQAVANYLEGMAEQRKAFYALLWKDQTEEQIHQQFPVLQHLSLKHLRSLLMLTHRFDLTEQKPLRGKAQVTEALLRKLEQIRNLDHNPRSFELLLRYVLGTSVDWNRSLCLDDDALLALTGICHLSAEERDNWNWLLERHGQSCGYVDLAQAWRAFRYFNQRYQNLVPGAEPLVLRKLGLDASTGADSIKNMPLFLDFLLTLIANARNKEEQLEELRSGFIKIQAAGSYAASFYQGYYLISPEMQLQVSKEQIAAAKAAAAAGVDDDAKRPSAVDYRVSRSKLIQAFREQKAELSLPVLFYRYIGMQKESAVTLPFYRNCMQDCQEAKEAKKANHPVLALLAITTANARAAGFQEAQQSRACWEQLKSRLSDPEFKKQVEELLVWHQAEGFPALSFVEATSLLQLWQQEREPGKRAALIQASREAITNDASRDAVLAVLRRVYAPRLLAAEPADPPHTLLAWGDYLKETAALAGCFEEEKAGNQTLWLNKLYLFVSRIAPEEKASSPRDWQTLVKGCSLSKSLIILLSSLPEPGCLSWAQVQDLFQKAEAFSKVEDEDEDEEKPSLLEWLHDQGEPYSQVQGFSVSKPGQADAGQVEAEIKHLISAYPLDEKQQIALSAVLGRLWEAKAPDEKEEKIPSKQSQQAENFLKALLAPDRIWHERRDQLIAILQSNQHIQAYGLSFLEDLLKALNNLAFIDPDLALFKELLEAKSPEQIRPLVQAQAAFCQAVEKICKLHSLKPNQRQRVLVLLRNAVAGKQLDSIETFSSWLTECCRQSPAACDDLLTVLNEALKTNQLQDTYALLARCTSSREQLPYLAPLMHGLVRKNIGSDLSLEILEACAGNPSILAILAKTLGGEHDAKRDLNLDIQGLMRHLKQLTDAKSENPEVLRQILTLCNHPPSLGISQLYKALSNEDGRLRETAAILEQLAQLEIDPHGRRLLKSPVDAKKLAQKVKAMQTHTRYADGQAKNLYRSQQRRLASMVRLVDALGKDRPAFGDQKALKPASRLTQAEIGALMQDYRQKLQSPGLNTRQKQLYLLQAIALMREAMYRATGKFANSTQILAVCNLMVNSLDDNCLTQIDAGQGKTLINGMNAACMWLLSKQVMVLTSDSGLAAHNLEENRGFFQLLGIPLGQGIVTQSSGLEDYALDGVTYSTFAGFELSRQKLHLDGQVKALATEEIGLVVDEFDDPYFDDHTDYRYTIPLIRSDSEGESPIAPFYYAMVRNFLDSPAYKILLADPKAREGDALALLEKFLHEQAATPTQHESLRKLLAHNPDQLKAWFISLNRARSMKEGIHFTVVTVEKVIDGQLIKFRKVCPYTTSKRANKEVEFSYGLQQLLQARMQAQNPGDPPFLIQQEAEAILSSNNQSVFHRKYRRIVGNTASIGSPLEISRRLRHFPFRVHVMPPHQDKRRQDHAAQLPPGDAAYEKAIKDYVRAYLKSDKTGPLLVITQHKDKLAQVQGWVNAVLEEEKQTAHYPVQSIDGEQTQDEEQKRIAKAGKPKTITLATPLAGRGFDVILDAFKEQRKSQGEEETETKLDPNQGLNVLLTDPPLNERKEVQYLGRGGRIGEPGNTDRIFKWQDLVTKDGQHISQWFTARRIAVPTEPERLLKAFYEANEAWDLHEAEQKNFLGEVLNVFDVEFKILHAEVLSLQDRQGTQKAFEDLNRGFIRHLHEEWQHIKERRHLEKAWLEVFQGKQDAQAYQAMLNACQSEFLAYASEQWNQEINAFINKALNTFRNQQQTRYEQQKRVEQESKERKGGTPPARPALAQAAAAAAAAPIAPVAAPSPAQTAEEEYKAVVAKISRVHKLLEGAVFTVERLGKGLVHKQAAYSDLPLASDEVEGEMELKEEDPAALLQGDFLDLTPAAVSLAGDPPTRKSQTMQALSTLVKSRAIEETTAKGDIVQTTEALLKRDFKDFKSVRLNLKEEKNQPKSIEIQYTLADDSLTETIHLYFDWTSRTVLDQAPRVVVPVNPPPSRPLPTPVPNASPGSTLLPSQIDGPTVPLAMDPEFKGTEETQRKTIKKRGFSISWYWFLLALLCPVGGATLTITGIAMSIGLPVTAGSVIAGGLSAALLSNPSFWILAGIGAAYGLALFLGLVVMAKIVQAIYQAVHRPLGKNLPLIKDEVFERSSQPPSPRAGFSKLPKDPIAEHSPNSTQSQRPGS